MIDPVGGGVARGGESVTQRRGVCARERSCRGEIELGAPCDLVTDFTAELPSLLESRLFVTRHRGSGFSRWNSPAFVCGSREKHCKKGGTMGRPRSVRSVRTVRRERSTLDILADMDWGIRISGPSTTCRPLL